MPCARRSGVTTLSFWAVMGSSSVTRERPEASRRGEYIIPCPPPPPYRHELQATSSKGAAPSLLAAYGLQLPALLSLRSPTSPRPRAPAAPPARAPPGPS